MSIGAKLGIKEKISGIIKGLGIRARSFKDANSGNPFIRANIASVIYANFRHLTNIVSGDVVPAGAVLRGR